MPDKAPVVTIAYKNTSEEDVPPYAFMQMEGDSHVVQATGAVSVGVKKPDGESGHFIIDSGKGASADDAGAYGQGVDPGNHIQWVHYTGFDDEGNLDPELTAWKTIVGPTKDEWFASTDGDGYVYAGVADSENERIQVKALSGGIPTAEGRLTTAITPAGNGRTSPTPFTFRMWVGDGSGVLKESANDTTGYNRSTQLSVGVNSYVVCVKINGTWRPVAWDETCQ